MKIDLIPIPEMTIEEFAEFHDLTMEVRERPYPEGDSGRYYAAFNGAHVLAGPFLRGVFGNGATPEEAIKDYARKINLARLVWNPERPDRRELTVPRLKP